MSTNTDLTAVNVTISTFSSQTSGNYSCSKNTGTTNITICVKHSVSTTSSPTTIMTTPKPGGLIAVRICVMVIGVIGLVIGITEVVLMILLFKRVDDGRYISEEVWIAVFVAIGLVIGITEVVLMILLFKR
ncbi:hypothetical protein DPMN_171137, partial [Dreissena polymorpha]